MPTGTALLDFGSFPGASDASVVVTGQTGIASGSFVEAWISPSVTADHTADEHVVETLEVVAGNIVAGTGFTIYGVNTNQVNEPVIPSANGSSVSPAPQLQQIGGLGTRLYGKWNISWAWV